MGDQFPETNQMDVAVIDDGNGSERVRREVRSSLLISDPLSLCTTNLSLSAFDEWFENDPLIQLKRQSIRGDKYRVCKTHSDYHTVISANSRDRIMPSSAF